MKKVSVVILNWNGADMLRRFLPSVVKFSFIEDEQVEIVVADNGSEDDSVSVVREEFPSVRVVELGENYGFAEGYNKALDKLDAEYAVLLNSDVEVTEDWLCAPVRFLNMHQNVAACQPKILSLRAREKEGVDVFEYAGAAGGYIDRWGYPFCRGRIFSTVERDEGQYDKLAPIFWASGAALFVRLNVFREMGGLDARFFAHMEEIDFCWRLRSRGYSVVCVPESKVYHLGAATLEPGPRKVYLNFRNNLMMLYKNLPEYELRKVLMFRAVADRLAALKFRLEGKSDCAEQVMKARADFRRARKDYTLERARNLVYGNNEDIQQRVPFSIVWRFFARRQKTFGELGIKKK